MNYKEVKRIIEAVEWTFAKTYADSYPHEYTLRERVGDDELFNDLIRFIRKEGKLKNFYERKIFYLEIDGREYWEMGRPTKAAKVLNRAGIDDNKEYRHKFPKPTEEEREHIYNCFKQRDYYVDYLLAKEGLSAKEMIELKYLLNSTRYSANNFYYREDYPRIYEMDLEELVEYINDECNGANVSDFEKMILFDDKLQYNLLD